MKNQKTYPTLINDQSITILKGNKPLTANRGHACFAQILDRVRRGNFNNIEQLFKIKDRIEQYFHVKIKNGNQVFYKNKPVHNALTEKIIGAMQNNLPYKPYVKFMDRLMDNPSEYCRNQLFNYVERYGFCLDSNGMLYGYKTINSKFRDKYTDTISYSPGRTVTMNRDNCEQNEQISCGPSLHLGMSEYVLNYGSDKGDKFVLVKFSPKDVISCPVDNQYQKLRVCKLTVVRQVERKDLLPLKDQYLGDVRRNSVAGYA